MFERYTEGARRSLFFARYEASNFGSVAIDTNHLLLGLLREGSVADFLSQTAVEAIRQQLMAGVGLRPPVPKSVEIPFGAEAKLVLRGAAVEADTALHGHIGVEHLLLALVAVEGNGVDDVLQKHGLGASAMREQIRDQATMPERGSSTSTPGPVSPETRRQIVMRELDAMIGFVAVVGREYGQTLEARRLVDQIRRDLASLKAAVFEK